MCVQRIVDGSVWDNKAFRPKTLFNSPNVCSFMHVYHNIKGVVYIM